MVLVIGFGVIGFQCFLQGLVFFLYVEGKDSCVFVDCGGLGVIVEIIGYDDVIV